MVRVISFAELRFVSIREILLANGTIPHHIFLAGFGAKSLTMIIKMETESGFGNPSNLHGGIADYKGIRFNICLLYTSPSPRD